MAEEWNTERATVSTYVPAYQKQRWAEHADRMGMSQSEFVRTMVQAGRRDFEVPERPMGEECGEAATSGLEPQVRDVLDPEDHRSWDELLERLTDDVEDRLEETLADLQEENVVQYRGRKGGYVLTDE